MPRGRSPICPPLGGCVLFSQQKVNGPPRAPEYPLFLILLVAYTFKRCISLLVTSVSSILTVACNFGDISCKPFHDLVHDFLLAKDWQK